MFFESTAGKRSLDQILESTRSGRLIWEYNRQTDSVRTATDRFLIEIVSADHDDLHPFILTLKSAINGTTVDTYHTGRGDDQSVIDKVHELYELSTLKAAGLDNVGNDLLEDLDDLEGPIDGGAN